MNSSMMSHSHCSGSSRGTGPSESGHEMFTASSPPGKEDGHTEEIIEQLAAVLVGVEPVVDVGVQTRVDMAVVEFTIEDEEDLVYETTSAELRFEKDLTREV